jgi:hypothetical protein
MKYTELCAPTYLCYMCASHKAWPSFDVAGVLSAVEMRSVCARCACRAGIALNWAHAWLAVITFTPGSWLIMASSG